MKAVKLVGPVKQEIVEIEKPKKDGENPILKITGCGICGSDLHYWKMGGGMHGGPLVLGHEYCGIIDDPGNRSDIKEGDRVTALTVNPCNDCIACKTGNTNVCTKAVKLPQPGNNCDGAYSEFLKILPHLVKKLPDSISDEEAVLIEPSSVALHSVNQADITNGEKVLVTGGGPIGLLSAMWAKLKGASYVALSEIDPFRQEFASKNGIVDEVFNAKDENLIRKMKTATKGGFDAVIESSASEPGINTGITALKPKGRIVLTGISFENQSIPTLLLVVKEIEMKSSFAYLPEEFDMTMEFIADKRLDVKKLITSQITLNEVQEAFQRMSGGDSNNIKILIRMA